MKNILIIGLCALLFVLSSCQDKEEDLPLVTPDCVQTIIGNLQENDTNPDCFASVKRYTFEGGDVFEVQTDACLDGPITIMDADCDTICTLVFEGFQVTSECGNSADFYNEAELIEVVFIEEN